MCVQLVRRRSVAARWLLRISNLCHNLPSLEVLMCVRHCTRKERRSAMTAPYFSLPSAGCLVAKTRTDMCVQHCTQDERRSTMTTPYSSVPSTICLFPSIQMCVQLVAKTSVATRWLLRISSLWPQSSFFRSTNVRSTCKQNERRSAMTAPYFKVPTAIFLLAKY